MSFIRQSSCLIQKISIDLFIYLFVYLSIYLFIYLFIASIHLFIMISRKSLNYNIRFSLRRHSDLFLFYICYCFKYFQFLVYITYLTYPFFI